MSEEPPIEKAAGAPSVSAHEGSRRGGKPLTMHEFEGYMGFWQDELHDPDVEMTAENRRAQQAVISRLNTPREPRPGMAPYTPDTLVKDNLADLLEIRKGANNDRDREALDRQVDVMSELWEMLDHPDNQRNLRTHAANWRKRQEAMQLDEADRLAWDAANAARRVVEEEAKPTPGAKQRPPESGFSGRHRAETREEAAPNLAETPVTTLPMIDGRPGQEIIDRAKHLATTFAGRQTAEDRAARRGIKLTHEELAAMDALVRLGRQVRDDLCKRYGIDLPSADALREAARHTPAGSPFKGDTLAEAKRIRAQAFTPEEDAVLHRISSALAPYSREGYVIASDMHTQLDHLETHTAIKFDNLATAGQFLKGLEWPQPDIDRILGVYRDALAKDPRARMSLSPARDPRFPNPADGRLDEKPMIGF